ncbi:hypothetical protein T4D_824 [Trichinella pseudospiralis]|uniref:Uncharacterized protein n=1 Tax=Trichinella pseudospiralis TaxID=6337 RepID=A0A0V1F6Y5_TRIPS|nr:hypothetical protein T4D_824 [Trichinella pseudospiralis]
MNEERRGNSISHQVALPHASIFLPHITILLDSLQRFAFFINQIIKELRIPLIKKYNLMRKNNMKEIKYKMFIRISYLMEKIPLKFFKEIAFIYIVVAALLAKFWHLDVAKENCDKIM